VSTQTVRFAKASPRTGLQHELTSPMPSALAALVPERAAQHAKVAAKLEALKARQVELAAELTASEKADQEEAEAAALAGRNPKRRQKTASLRNRLEDCEGEISRFASAVQTSADALLAVALPLRERATENAVKAQEAATSRARELLAAVDAALEEAANLTAEQAWLASLDRQRHVPPFRPGAASDPGIRRLRTTLSAAFGEWEQKNTEYREEAERQGRWAEEHRDEWTAREEHARRQAEQQRVVIEGGRIIERGGRPVRKGAFGVEEVPEEGQQER
jgi:hypothetical protein